MEKLSNSDSHREGAERGALASSHTSPLQTFGSSHSPLHTSLSTPLLSTPLLLSSSQKNTTPLHTSGPSRAVVSCGSTASSFARHQPSARAPTRVEAEYVFVYSKPPTSAREDTHSAVLGRIQPYHCSRLPRIHAVL